MLYEQKRGGGHQKHTYPIQPVNGYCFKGSSHHGVFLQNLVEVVHRERIQAAVCVSSHTGGAAALGQKADFWDKGKNKTQEGKEMKWFKKVTDE